MAVGQFRAFINRMALDKDHYFPVATELKGGGNIISGVLQIIVGNGMKYSSNPTLHTVQSKRHIDRGTKILAIGFKQFVPGAVICYALYSAYYWMNRDVRDSS
jgi:hypothetical protein